LIHFYKRKLCSSLQVTVSTALSDKTGRSPSFVLFYQQTLHKAEVLSISHRLNIRLS